MITTSRLGLEVPQSIDNESAYPAASAQQMGVLDNAVTITQGTLVSRPAATAVPVNTMYYATDTGLYYVTNGTSWTQILNYGFGTMIPRTATTTTTGNPGDLILASPGVSVNLSTSSPVGSVIGVIASTSVSGASPVTINAGVSHGLVGVGITSSITISLGTPYAHVVFQLTSASAWTIISGQQDTGWLPLTLASGIVSDAPNSYDPAIRVVGNQVMLRGGAFNNTGATYGGSGNFATLPSGAFPTARQAYMAATVGTTAGQVIASNISGQLSWGGPAWAANQTVNLDGLNYSLS